MDVVDVGESQRAETEAHGRADGGGRDTASPGGGVDPHGHFRGARGEIEFFQSHLTQQFARGRLGHGPRTPLIAFPFLGTSPHVFLRRFHGIDDVIPYEIAYHWVGERLHQGGAIIDRAIGPELTQVEGARVDLGRFHGRSLLFSAADRK